MDTSVITQRIDKYRYAWHATSFDPEKRFQSFKLNVLATISEIKSFCNDKNYDSEWIVNKVADCAIDYLSAQSQCMSSAITGPANFPVAKNESRMSSRENKYDKYIYYASNYEKILTKKHTPKETEEDKITKWTKQVEKAKQFQDLAKRTNVLIRKHKLTNLADCGLFEELKEIFIKEPLIEDCLKTNMKINYPFIIAGYTLTNNLANIKRLEGQLKAIERTKEANQETSFNFDFVKVEHDNDELRWNLFFNGKPEEDTRKELKRNGFKWSPKRGAWTRGSKTMQQSRLQGILSTIKDSEVK
jgi:hypothetical protein